jgi:hypothetical protein
MAEQFVGAVYKMNDHATMLALAIKKFVTWIVDSGGAYSINQ